MMKITGILAGWWKKSAQRLFLFCFAIFGFIVETYHILVPHHFIMLVESKTVCLSGGYWSQLIMTRLKIVLVLKNVLFYPVLHVDGECQITTELRFRDNSLHHDQIRFQQIAICCPMHPQECKSRPLGEDWGLSIPEMTNHCGGVARWLLFYVSLFPFSVIFSWYRYWRLCQSDGQGNGPHYFPKPIHRLDRSLLLCESFHFVAPILWLFPICSFCFWGHFPFLPLML